MTLTIDGIKAPARNELVAHKRWENRLHSELVIRLGLGTSIEVKQLVDCISCGGTALYEDQMCRNCRQENYGE